MEREGVAWIAEDSDGDDGLMAAGRFSGHIEDGDDPDAAIEDASLDEALAWARECCDVVLIRLWDSDYYSAGTTNPDPGEYAEWVDPPEPIRRRRPRGLEALDNTEDSPPVPWDVRLSASWLSDEELLEAVRRDERAEPVPEDPRHAKATGARVFVRAPTRRQAEAIAEDMLDRALATLRGAGSGGFSDGYQVYPYSPDAPVIFGSF
jgi:hypothetical protein